jgi:hypothetical protein
MNQIFSPVKFDHPVYEKWRDKQSEAAKKKGDGKSRPDWRPIARF